MFFFDRRLCLNTHSDEKADVLDEFVIIEVGVNSWIARQIDECFQRIVGGNLVNNINQQSPVRSLPWRKVLL
jgi:hypothetical protein